MNAVTYRCTQHDTVLTIHPDRREWEIRTAPGGPGGLCALMVSGQDLEAAGWPATAELPVRDAMGNPTRLTCRVEKVG